MNITQDRRMFLHRAASEKLPRGTSINYEIQAGRVREMRWCERKGLVLQVGGRMEATDIGRAALAMPGLARTP